MSTLAYARFRAEWAEGTPSARGRVRSADTPGGTVPPSPWAAVEFADGPEIDEGVLLSIEAERRGLPTLYRPAGIVIPDPLPVLMEHTGAVLGHAIEVEPVVEGERITGFVARGLVEGDAFPELFARPYLSPGIVADAAEIVTMEGFGDVFHVTRSRLVELSATIAPSRPGTSFVVWPPGKNVTEAMVAAFHGSAAGWAS